MNIEALIPDYVRNFEAYIPSKPDHRLMQEYGVSHLYRLNNNENFLGPPVAARRIIENFRAGRALVYPSGDSYDLRVSLARKLGVGEDGLLIGNGSCEVISAVIKALCEAGDNIITADKTFAVYEWVAEFSGIEARLVPLVDYAFDPQGMLERIDEKTKIIFICNPNNPTGTYWSRDVLVAFLEQVGDNRIVVIDEAYKEYVEAEDYPDGVSLMERFPNVVVFRTFSKMYALAGLRIGYLIGTQEVTAAVRRTFVAYSVNSLAQPAAQAAIEDDADHIARTCTMVKESRALMEGVCRELGLQYVSGEGNYLMIKVPVNDLLMYRRLMRKGMMVRSMTGFRFPGWIRVTLRERQAIEAFASVLTDEIRALRSSAGKGKGIEGQ
jgi:histidinol-phosphate aminotransferase